MLKGKKLFVLSFDMDEAEFYTTAKTQKEAVEKFINHIKDNLCELEEYVDSNGKILMGKCSKLVNCRNITKDFI
jgi:hypothetical protein